MLLTANSVVNIQPMAPNYIHEEPIDYDGASNYFMASLADLCPFIKEGIYCGRPAKLPTCFRSYAHQTMVRVGPNWETCMRDFADVIEEGVIPSAQDIWEWGRDFHGLKWRLRDVTWYHNNHVGGNYWFTEENLNIATAYSGDPCEQDFSCFFDIETGEVVEMLY